MKCRICNREVKQSQGRKRKRCDGCNTKIRRYRMKQAAVKLLGGKCIRCGWKGKKNELAGYQFHHPDDNKEFGIGKVANKSWDTIKKELMKCELICARCHCIEHSNMDDDNFLREVDNYKGRLLD